MTTQSAPQEHDDLLTFRGHSIRIARADSGVPWFALPDLCDALNRRMEYDAPRVAGPHFPSFARCTLKEETEEGLQDITLLSPVGVFFLTALTEPWKGAALTNWARKEAQRLCPNPTPGDPAIFLTYMEDGDLPPCPTKYSGRRAEWNDLRYSPNRPIRQPLESRQELQARLLAEAVARRAPSSEPT
jgi:hypothetical protein